MSCADFCKRDEACCKHLWVTCEFSWTLELLELEGMRKSQSQSVVS